MSTASRPNLGDPQTYQIIGAAMAVHRELGCGFLEAVYHPALAIELTARGVPFASEVTLPIFYRRSLLSVGYRADFVCYDAIIVEIKALSSLSGVDDAILINYLKAAQLRRGLLLNFGARSLDTGERSWSSLLNRPSDGADL